MSKQTFTKSRRSFLKSAAYTSMITASGLSGMAIAAEALSPETASQESVVLFNQSGETVQLDATQPVNLELVNGWAVVKINKQMNSNETAISLTPGQRQSFKVDPVLAPLLGETGNYIVITSEFTALNNVVPISTVDAVVA